MDGGALQIAQILRHLVGILHAVAIFQLLHPADTGLEILQRIGGSGIKHLCSQVGIHVVLTFGLHNRLVLYRALSHLLLELEDFLVIFISTHQFEILALAALHIVDFNLRRVDVHIDHALVDDEDADFAIIADVLIYHRIAHAHDETVLVVIRPCHTVLIFGEDFIRRRGFQDRLMIGKRILGIVAVGIHHYVKAFRDVVLVRSKGAYPAVLGERGAYPHLLALVHEEMLLHVAVIIIRGIFAREQSCLIGLLLLYLSILEIGGKGAGKLALGIILLVEDHKAAFALQFATHIVGAELLGCRRISRIECQAIIVGESLVRGYLPAFVVIKGIQPVLRNGRSFRDNLLS